MPKHNTVKLYIRCEGEAQFYISSLDEDEESIFFSGEGTKNSC